MSKGRLSRTKCKFNTKLWNVNDWFLMWWSYRGQRIINQRQKALEILSTFVKGKVQYGEWIPYVKPAPAVGKNRRMCCKMGSGNWVIISISVISASFSCLIFSAEKKGVWLSISNEANELNSQYNNQLLIIIYLIYL